MDTTFEPPWTMLRRLCESERARNPASYSGPSLNWQHRQRSLSMLIERYQGRASYIGPMIGSSAGICEQRGERERGPYGPRNGRIPSGQNGR